MKPRRPIPHKPSPMCRNDERELSPAGPIRTQAQVAELLKVTRGCVSANERSAIAKLRPLLRDLRCDWGVAR